MALIETSLTNIFEPEIAIPYFIQQTIEKSALWQSGVISSNADLQFAVANAGRLVDMPHYDDLSHDTGATDRSKPVTDTDDTISPDGATTSVDIAHKDFRAQSWKTAEVVRYNDDNNLDPLMVFMNKYIPWWTKEFQRLTLIKANAIFDGTLNSTHVYDIASESIAGQSASTKISSGAIQEGRFLLGDHYDGLGAMIVHSKIYKDLENQDLITFMPTSGQLMQQIPFYHGLRVIVDDGMTVEAGSTDGFKYSTYLFGEGAFGFANTPLTGEHPNLALHLEPKEGTGAGSTELITRNLFLLHPIGVKWQGTVAGTYPTDTELGTTGSWAKVYPDKLIRMVRIVTN